MKVKVLIFACVMLAGCSTKVYFSQSFREQLEETGTPLDKLQYYSKNDLIFRRNVTESKRAIEGGLLKESSKSTRQVIVFSTSRFQPLEGVCKEWKNDALGIYFETGDSTRRVPFVMDNEGYYKFYTPSNLIEYDGSIYSVEGGNGSYLFVKKSDTRRFKVQKRRVRGLRVK